jgi:hypothetical protein
VVLQVGEDSDMPRPPSGFPKCGDFVPAAYDDNHYTLQTAYNDNHRIFPATYDDNHRTFLAAYDDNHRTFSAYSIG